MKRNTQRNKEWIKILGDRASKRSLYRHSTKPNLYQVRLKSVGDYKPKRFYAENDEAAILDAPRVAGHEPQRESPEQFSILASFKMTLADANRGITATNEWWRISQWFIDWLEEKHPGATHWHLLTRSIVREYKDRFRHLSNNSQRLYLQPIRQTSGFMNREYELPNIAERLALSGKPMGDPKKVYLEDVLDLLNYAAEYSPPSIEAGIALQGLWVLQLQEALRLTWDKVDLSLGLIEISGDVKNSYRNRVIPVCARVVQAMKRADKEWKSGTVQDFRRPVVSNSRQGPYEDYRSYSRIVRALLKKWNSRIDWACKDLRNCLPTFAVEKGIHSMLWEQYLGHAPRTVTGINYVARLTAVSRGEGQALERAMDAFLRVVVEPLETAIRGETEGEICNFLQLGSGGPPDKLQISSDKSFILSGGGKGT